MNRYLKYQSPGCFPEVNVGSEGLSYKSILIQVDSKLTNEDIKRMDFFMAGKPGRREYPGLRQEVLLLSDLT